MFGCLVGVWDRLGLSWGRLGALMTALDSLAKPGKDVQEDWEARGTVSKGVRRAPKPRIPGVRFWGGEGVPPPRIVKI